MRLLLVKCRSDKSWLVIGVAEAFSLLVADQGGLCVFPFGNNDAGIGVGAYGFVSSTWSLPFGVFQKKRRAGQEVCVAGDVAC